MDDYCNFCGAVNGPLMVTNDGKSICVLCAKILDMCEVCGSLRKKGETEDEQHHYDEDCFK